MILDTLFPKVFALISSFEEELDYVFIITLEEGNSINFKILSWALLRTHISLGMQFNQKFLAFKRKLSNFGPRECVDPRNSLKNGDSKVSYGKVQWNALVILGCVHFHAEKLATSRCLKQIEIGLSWGLSSDRKTKFY